MPDRSSSNATEQLQVRYRNWRTRDLYGSHAIDPYEDEEPQPVVTGTPIRLDETRRAKHREVTNKTQEILDRALDLSLTWERPE